MRFYLDDNVFTENGIFYYENAGTNLWQILFTALFTELLLHYYILYKRLQ